MKNSVCGKSEKECDGYREGIEWFHGGLLL